MASSVVCGGEGGDVSDVGSRLRKLEAELAAKAREVETLRCQLQAERALTAASASGASLSPSGFGGSLRDDVVASLDVPVFEGIPRDAHQLARESVGVRAFSKNLSRALIKLDRPSSVMIVAKVFDRDIIAFTRVLACNLVDSPPRPYIDSKLRNHDSFRFDELALRFPHYRDRIRFWTTEFCASNDDSVDFIITLGGDGTVLYTSWLFQKTQVPPVVPFHLGSLGFLTNFDIAHVRDVLGRVLGCGATGVRVNMRMRLSCTIFRAAHYLNRKQGAIAVTLPRHPAALDAAKSHGNLVLDAPDAAAGATAGGTAAATSGARARPFFLNGVTATAVTMRRLSDPAHDEDGADEPLSALERVARSLASAAFPDGAAELGRGVTRAVGVKDGEHDARLGGAAALHLPPAQRKPVPAETFQILNDLVIDRGPSSFMSQLEVFVDDRHLTSVQADGLVVATPTGSTAYSMSANGSIVHPEVPSILLTPICPHTLSFRPMLLPDSSELRLQIPMDSRSTAWVSFDGRHRTELRQGDYVTVTMSSYPMPTVCDVDQSADWFKSLKNNLHWNERARQKGFTGIKLPPSHT
ncbi:hypothetical protein HK405_006390 [Cladochytrium tenue]|nr:hypothetical protein HK405_006390 [Cladochytrium tenue]